MDGTTTPDAGTASDNAGDDFKILDVTVDPGENLPVVKFYYRGQPHSRIDQAIYALCIGTSSPKFGLKPHHAELIKQAGIACRKKNGLAPWPYPDHKAPTTTAPRPTPAEQQPKPTPPPAARKAKPPAHTFKILGEPYNEAGYPMVRFEHDGKEDALTVQQLYEDVKNFPDQFPPQAEGEVRDLWLETLEAKGRRKEDERGIEWPQGGIEPITADTFTEARALELGIVHTDQRGAMRVSVHEAARYIMDHITFANIRTGDSIDLHYYSEGIFHRQGDVLVGMTAERLLGQYATNKNVAEVLGKIKRSCPPRDTDDQDIEGWHCVKNGYLKVMHDPGTPREFEPHHPGRVFTTQRNVIYDPSKTECPNFARFLVEITDLPTDPQAILELMGYCLMPGYKYQHLFIFLGEGRNGKGTLKDVLTEILGEGSVSQVTLHMLSNRPFAACELHRKLANICGDLDASHLKNTGLIKMVTGNDRIMADRKNRDALNFRNQAKMIVLCNKIPYTQDDKDGFVCRPRVFRFPRQFMDDKRDVNLLEKLTTEDEKSAILNLMLDGLDRLRKQGYFTGRDNDREEANRYLIMQNPAGTFLSENMVSDVDHFEPIDDTRPSQEGQSKIYMYGWRTDWDDLWNYYLEWCEDGSYEPGTREEMKIEIRRKFPNASETKWGKYDNPDGKTGRCWKGIRFEPKTEE